MGEPETIHSRSSRHRYRGFVKDYKQGRIDTSEDDGEKKRDKQANGNGDVASPALRREKRREYLREYLRWLRPHRYAIGALFLFALVSAGLEMAEPLFMRHIVD